jgi:hypothetical protein
MALFLLQTQWTSLVVSQRIPHRYLTLTSKRTLFVSQCSTIDNIRDYDLPAVLKVRVPDTPTHTEVKEVQ